MLQKHYKLKNEIHLKTFIYSLLESLIKPINEELLYFIFIYFSSSYAVLFRFIRQGNFEYTLYLCLVFIWVTYLITFVVCLNKKLSYFLKPITLLILISFNLLNLTCNLLFNSPLSPEFVETIINTNIQESKEFIDTYISSSQIIIIAICYFFLSFLYFKFCIHTKRTPLKYQRIGLGLLLLSIIATFHNPSTIKEIYGSDQLWSFKFDEIVDLSKHLCNPVIKETDSIHPKNVILVIGESFSKSHSSLYGYSHKTNILLEEYLKDGTLYTFKDAHSPAEITTTAFKFILNTHKRRDKGKWYQYPTIIELMHTAGYNTTWISNQNSKGLVDNLPSGFSRICDNAFFNDKKINKYDDWVLSINVNKIKTNKSNFVIYHLMGQHENFKERYPSSFQKFKANDYKGYDKSQRENLANYDNATLYNDFVISSIIKSYSNSESILFYYPDHALDIYESSKDRCGHAIKTNKESFIYGTNIPFIIYISPSLKKKNPVILEKIKNAMNKHLNTEDATNIILDIVGFRIQK